MTYRAQASADFRANEARYLAEGEYPSWSANNQIAFRGWGNTGTGLRLASADFANRETLTSSGEDFAPAISPGGQQIAFMSQSEGN